MAKLKALSIREQASICLRGAELLRKLLKERGGGESEWIEQVNELQKCGERLSTVALKIEEDMERINQEIKQKT